MKSYNFRKAPFVYPVTTELRDYDIRGTGDPMKICLRIMHDGLGDDIHMMPAVQGLIDLGYDVTVLAEPFARKCWESLGAKFIDRNSTSMGWLKKNRENYGRMPSLTQWSVWQRDSEKTRFEQIADLIGSELPETFSWINALKPNFSLDRGYILFAPQSASEWRSMPEWKRISLFRKLKKEHGDVRYSEVLRGSWLYEKALRLLGIRKVICKDFNELIDLVYNAKGVVSVDTGVTQIAAAFGVPLIALFGLTEKKIAEQFERYVIGKREAIQGGGDYPVCKSPCYSMGSRGFVNGKCCGEYKKPVCLDRIPDEKIVRISQIVFS